MTPSAASSKTSAAPSTQATAPAGPVDFETFLAKLGAKDRLNIERHLAACEAEPEASHAKLWRRLATLLASLAPHATKTTGQQTVQFFIPDGKYRMQVFALQDLRDGKVILYVGNVLPQALKEGILSGPVVTEEELTLYRIGKTKETLAVDELDGKTTNPSPFFKDMLGWNRTALRVTLRTAATPAQVNATEALCQLAAKKWAGKA